MSWQIVVSTIAIVYISTILVWLDESLWAAPLSSILEHFLHWIEHYHVVSPYLHLISFIFNFVPSNYKFPKLLTKLNQFPRKLNCYKFWSFCSIIIQVFFSFSCWNLPSFSLCYQMTITAEKQRKKGGTSSSSLPEDKNE